jgi:hypothetical protein
MKRSGPCAFALLLLAACSTDRAVEARILKTGESFTGTASPGTFGGSLEMQSSVGAKCTGRTTTAESIGSTVVVLVCDDGRVGSVILLDGARQSTGSGVLGEDQVTLSITQ